MDKLRAAVAEVTEAIARSRPMRSLRALLAPAPGTKDGQRGQGLAEYALILALIAIVAIVSLAFLGVSISEMFMDPISEDFGEVLSRLGI
jgi:Flp pilus assembly pilin Flp